MVSELLPCPFCGEKPQITKHHREDIYSFMHRCPVLGPISWGFREDQQAHVEKWNARAQPAPQPHPEPIAWMVGTAIWWTKEEAERDAAETGKPIIPFGPMIDTGEVDRLRAALKFYADREHYHFESGNWDTVSGEPLNILWCGDEPDFIEDGTVARNALFASAEPIKPAAPYPNRLCHIDYTAHPYLCGCLKGDDEAQRIYDEHCRAALERQP
ncbi:hypothetical protein PPUJ13061_32540 [Pseudomonas putida]|nr:hypothetical protein PPUJ13061_32540 [Pseudomonas putida]